MPPPTEAAAADTPSPGPRPPAAGSANTGLRKNTRADSPHPAASASTAHPPHTRRTPSRRHHRSITAPSPRQARLATTQPFPARHTPLRSTPLGRARHKKGPEPTSPTRRRLSSPAPPQPPPPRRPPEPRPPTREPLGARAHKPPHRAPGTPQPPAPAAAPSH